MVGLRQARRTATSSWGEDWRRDLTGSLLSGSSHRGSAHEYLEALTKPEKQTDVQEGKPGEVLESRVNEYL